MKVDLILPIDVLRGKLRNDGYYFRQYRGQQVVQQLYELLSNVIIVSLD